MPPKLRGKWAQGIKPRHFTWILKDKLAICERPGGYGDSHRRVRRQEEIIWLRENGFTCAISIIQAPHNLHNYEELNLPYRHRPFDLDQRDAWLRFFYREIDEMLKGPNKIVVHGEEYGDKLAGIMGGYLRWAGLIDDDTKATILTERLTGRKLDPFARSIVIAAGNLKATPPASPSQPASDAETEVVDNSIDTADASITPADASADTAVGE